MGFFDWLFRRQPLVPEETPPAQDPEQELYEYGMSPDFNDCTVEYVPGRKEGKVNVLPRWRTAHPDVDCIRDLFTAAGYRSAYSVIICGEPCSEYPGHEGEDEICLTYKFEGNYMRSIVSNPDYVDAQSFGNLVNLKAPEGLVDCWSTVVEIAVIDN